MNAVEKEFINLDFEEEIDDDLPDFCYVQLQGWMVKMARSYGLALNELMIYALIHGFSQDGSSFFRGSRDYMRLWAFCGRTSVFGKVKKLLDLKLIGREYVKYKGKSFPAYFTFASRDAMRGRKKLNRNSVQKLNTDNIDSEEFKNRTESVHNVNKNSSKSGPNNDLNNDLKKAAAFIKSKITEYLGINSFSDNFNLILAEKLSSEGFNFERMDSFLDYVMERVKVKKPESLPAMFWKLVQADDVLSDFKSVSKENEIVKKIESCPVCGGTFVNGCCDSCGFFISEIHDRDAVNRAKRMAKLTKEQKMEYEAELDRICEELPFGGFNLEAIRKRTEMMNAVERKFGLLD